MATTSSEHSSSSSSASKGKGSSVFDLFSSWNEKDEKEKKPFLDQMNIEQMSSTDQDEEDVASEEKQKERTSEGPWGGLSNIVTSLLKSHGAAEEEESSNVESLLQKARDFADKDADFQESKSGDELNKLRNELNNVLEQMKKSFSHVAIDKINPIAFLYYLEREDSIKTPSYKRRKHRFMPSLDLSTVNALHDALYFSELSYLDTVDDIKEGLASFKGSPYEMIYCSIDGKPRQPAHYIAIQKAKESNESFSLPWQKKEKCLQVLVVVRGTKEIADVLSDSLLDTFDYRNGKAHNGVAEAGMFLVKKHTALLEHLLEESKYDKICLSLVGHSLGGGAAAIAAIEFNDHPNMEATATGFGCPALLSKELSESTKDYITTIISDSDIVPRMSGATIANMLLDVMSLDFRDKAGEDVKELLNVAKDNLPFPIPENKIAGAIEWVNREIEKSVKSMAENVPEERSEVVLYPPGKCVHLYRDGVGISASYVPCDFFNEVDVSRTMVQDHLTASGYDKMFVELMRGHEGNSRFEFRHDVAGVITERDKRLKSAHPDDE